MEGEKERERERWRKRNSEERTGMATGSHCLRGFYHTNDDALLPRHYYFWRQLLLVHQRAATKPLPLLSSLLLPPPSSSPSPPPFSPLSLFFLFFSFFLLLVFIVAAETRLLPPLLPVDHSLPLFPSFSRLKVSFFCTLFSCFSFFNFILSSLILSFSRLCSPLCFSLNVPRCGADTEGAVCARAKFVRLPRFFSFRGIEWSNSLVLFFFYFKLINYLGCLLFFPAGLRIFL